MHIFNTENKSKIYIWFFYATYIISKYDIYELQ